MLFLRSHSRRCFSHCCCMLPIGSWVQSMNIGFDYVLVLEWLGNGDRRTGTELHAFLQRIGIESELIVCENWDDVSQALRLALSEIATKGRPAVHLETHGSDPWEGREENIGFGSDVAAVPWSRLGALLAPLNVANDFRLVFISAACWGSGVMAAMGSGEYSAPFASAIGFETPVDEKGVGEAMREFYRSIKREEVLADCVANAQRELAQGQRMRLDFAAVVAAKILRQVILHPVNPNTTVGPMRRLRRAREVWDRWFPTSLQARDPSYRFAITRLVM